MLEHDTKRSDSGERAESGWVPSYLEEVRDYYDTTTGAYLSDYGTSLQVMIAETGPQKQGDFSASNLYFAGRAGIKPGDHVLDAGCGVCGPSIDLAKNIEGITIDAMTISPVQAGIARRLVQEAGLTQRITVHIGDYHRLPFHNDVFDAAIFFESSGYSYDQTALFSGVSRVLRAGGALYVKDVFRDEEPLTPQQRHDLQEFNRIYRYLTAPISASEQAIRQAGFIDVEVRNLGKHDGLPGEPGQLATGHRFYSAMTQQVNGARVATAFGKAHLYPFTALPIYFGDIRARKPQA